MMACQAELAKGCCLKDEMKDNRKHGGGGKTLWEGEVRYDRRNHNFTAIYLEGQNQLSSVRTLEPAL